MPAFAVVTAFKGIDGVSKPLKKMLKATAAFGNMADRSFSRASKKASMFGSVLKGVLGSQVITGGINLLRTGISSVTDEFIAFDQAATSAAAKFNDGVKRGTAQFEKLKKTAREVGATTKFTAAEAAKGLDFLALSSFTSDQAMTSLAGVAELATNAEIDLGRAAEIASNSLAVFGLKVKDDVELEKNLIRVNNTLAKTFTSAAVDIEQVFETMKFGAAAAADLGADIETVATLTAAMGDKMIKGSMGGTALRTMFLNLVKPTGEAKTLLKKIGLTVDAGGGKFKDIIRIVQEFNDKTKKMTEMQKSAAVATIFGKRAVSGVQNILKKGSVELFKFRQRLHDTTTASSDMAAEINQGLGNRLLTLKSSLIEVGFKFIDAFEKKIPGAIDMAINAVRKFDVKKVLDQIHRFGLFIDRVVELVRDLSPLIWGAVAAFTAYKGIIIAAEAAQWLLNIALGANPVGATILAIGLVVAAIVYLVKNWDTVVEVMQEFWIDFKMVMGKMWDWFKKMLDNPFFRAITGLFGPLLTIPATIMRNWEPIKEFFKGVLDFIKPAVDLAIKGAKKVGGFLGFGDVKDNEATGVKPSLRDKFKDQQKKFSESLTPLVKKPLLDRLRDQQKKFSEKERTSPREAPNKKELASKAQIDFQGRMMFDNVPSGAKLEGKTRGAPPIQLDMSGQN